MLYLVNQEHDGTLLYFSSSESDTDEPLFISNDKLSTDSSTCISNDPAIPQILTLKVKYLIFILKYSSYSTCRMSVTPR